MHRGVFIGNNVRNQEKRILILGESHHWSKGDWELKPNETEEQAEERRKKKAEEYETKKVITNYLDNYKTRSRDRAYQFFEKIILSFGLDPERERETFWNNVYFGNYIEELCGIKDGKAANVLKTKNGGILNREKYNDTLFEFINLNRIDIVFCFGRLVFNNLPSLNKEYFTEEKCQDKIEIKKSGKPIDYIANCAYLPDINHKSTNFVLKKRLDVYGLKHPSAYGFNPENYVDVLKKLL